LISVGHQGSPEGVSAPSRGIGFVLFARAQPDTPGKLVAHALSYEALERASYELLGRVAPPAGETDVVASAGRISGQEEAMMDRLSGLFDRSVDASLRAVGSDALSDQPAKYLADAHAIEEHRVAERVGDESTIRTLSAILDEERAAAAKLEGAFDPAADASLEAVGVTGRA
jgi:ferritin-like metal-binding protein YciE